ncbi:MAG: hypothetical protein A2161_07905 [Candidatus Schekmanbacteria bacterium RBG_13_48_7]|uniref:Peptidase M1 membrane alanine aminopeptidase domain-containing protein n=1 Tax=Candidatus Schekmanbacteria bacterium RBG_13_48_7 TaxID=1817878 RepID=A0A1F7RJN3_9BACT|nr:MAG: hypothetical protein A2161_07905 [Candidatus Schekmanbacteria bacterium RBG_13_48_7]
MQTKYSDNNYKRCYFFKIFVLISVFFLFGLLAAVNSKETEPETTVLSKTQEQPSSQFDIQAIKECLNQIIQMIQSKGLKSVSFEKDVSSPRIFFTSEVDQEAYSIVVDVKEKVDKISHLHIDNPENIRFINGEVLANIIIYIEYDQHADIQNWEIVFQKRNQSWQAIERRIIQYYSLYKITVQPGDIYKLKDFDLSADSVKVHVKDGILAIGSAGNIPTAGIIMGNVEFDFAPNIRMEADVLQRIIGSPEYQGTFKALYMRFYPEDLTSLVDVSKLESEPSKNWRDRAQAILDERESAIDDLDLRIKSAHMSNDWSFVPRNKTYLLLEVMDINQYWKTYIHDPIKDEQVWFGQHKWNILATSSVKETWCRYSCLHQENPKSELQHPQKEIIDIQHYSLAPQVASDGLICSATVDFTNRGEMRKELEFTLYRELETLSVLDETNRALIFFPMGNHILVPLASVLEPQQKRSLTFLYRGNILTSAGEKLQELTNPGREVDTIDSSSSTQESTENAIRNTDVLGTGEIRANTQGDSSSDAQTTTTQVEFAGNLQPFWPEEFNEVGAGDGGDVLFRSSPQTFFDIGFFPWIPSHGYRDRATVDMILKVPQPFDGVSVGKKIKDWTEGFYNCSHWEEKTEIVQPAFCFGYFKTFKGDNESTELTVLGEDNIRATLESTNLGAPLGDRLNTPGNVTGSFNSSSRDSRLVFNRNEKRLLYESNNVINLFNEMFGKYPFEKLTLAQMPSNSRYNFNIVPASYTLLPLSLFLSSAQKMQIDSPLSVRFNADLLGANLAKQWLGQLVGSNSYHDQWVLDSLAEYCGGIFLQAVFGDDEFKNWLKNIRKMAEKYDNIGPLFMGPRLGGKYVDLYRGKGVYIMHMLRMMMGDKYFIEAIQNFTRMHRFQNASTDDFKKAFEIIGITDLDYFFDQWVYSTGIPKFEFSYQIEKQKDDQFIFKGKVIQKGKIVKMPMPLWIYSSSNDKGKIIVWIEKPEEDFSFVINKLPKKVTFDEFHWCLGDVTAQN